jgi:hypothetical protein
MCSSKRAVDWVEFSSKVCSHIDEYTVPQYGDKGVDLASTKDAAFFMAQIERYVTRFGKNQRSDQENLDLLKIAHYAQLAYDSLNSAP